MVCEKDGAMFRLGQRNALKRIDLPEMTTELIQTCYERIKKKVMGLMNTRMYGLRRTSRIWVVCMVRSVIL